MNRLRRLLLTLCHARAVWKALDAPKNRVKGDWRGDDIRDLLKALNREVEELTTACWHYECQGGEASRVKEEAADVSAFAAMIADVCRKNN